MSFDPELIYKRMVELGQKWAELDEKANGLEEHKSTLKAKLVLEAMRSDPKMSVSKAEYLAYANPAFSVHIDGMVAARSLALSAKVKYDAFKMQAENERTKQVNLRKANEY